MSKTILSDEGGGINRDNLHYDLEIILLPLHTLYGVKSQLCNIRAGIGAMSFQWHVGQ